MTEGHPPKVSICIPAYNCERFVLLAMESALNQTFQNFELIVLDDRSTDKTLENVSRFSDPRLRIIENEKNIGHQENWNKALKEAKGEFIKILPPDDLLYPECLEVQLAVFEDPQNQDVVLACSTRDIIDEQGKKLLRRSFKNWQGKTNGLKAIQKNVRAGTNLIGEPAAVLFKKAIIEKAGFFDDTYYYVIDLDLWIRILLHGDLYIIPESLCAFRVSSLSSSVKVASSQSRDFKRFISTLGDDNRYHLSKRDIFLGKARASLYELLRKFFTGRFASKKIEYLQFE